MRFVYVNLLIYGGRLQFLPTWFLKIAKLATQFPKSLETLEDLKKLYW